MLTPGLTDNGPLSRDDFQRGSPITDPTQQFTDERTDSPSRRFGESGSRFPETNRLSSLSQRPDGLDLQDSRDFNLETSQGFDDDDDSLLDRINSNRLPDTATTNLQSFFNGDPVEDQPVLEIFEGIQTVQDFPVNDDGTLSGDDIDDLQDTLDDEEERVEELVDEGRLSKAQSNLIQAEIEPLRSGLDLIDENSIDTGDRLIDGGKTFASVLDPLAGTAVTLLDEVGILDPIGGFLGDAWDATIGAIFKK